jgi:cell division protein FtsL
VYQFYNTLPTPLQFLVGFVIITILAGILSAVVSLVQILWHINVIWEERSRVAVMRGERKARENESHKLIHEEWKRQQGWKAATDEIIKGE